MNQICPLDIFFLPGFGSTERTVDRVAKALSLGKQATRVSGVAFLDAMNCLDKGGRQRDEMLEAIDGSDVVTNSGGALVLKRSMAEHDVRPRSATLTAVPVPTPVRTLLARGVRAGWHDRAGGPSMRSELRHHLARYAGVIRQISDFDGLNIEHLASVPTELVLSSHDEIFNYKTHVDRLRSLRVGGVALSVVDGGHCQFTSDPLSIVGAALPRLDIDELDTEGLPRSPMWVPAAA